MKFQDVGTQLPPDQIVPLKEVAALIQELWNLLQKKLKGRKMPQSKEKSCRLRILKQDIKWARFAQTHPLIFDRVVSHDTTEKEITALLYMLFLKDQEVAKGLNGAKEKLREYLFQNFARDETNTAQQAQHVSDNLHS
jgi:hypothetical protein